MKPASLSNPILSFFSRHGLYFHPTKDRCWTRPTSTFLYICCNFGQIFCTNVIQSFSVQNMGHDQLKKYSKYHLVLPTCCTFLIQLTTLTHSALHWQQKWIVPPTILVLTGSAPKSTALPSPPLGSSADSAFFWELVFMAPTISFVSLNIHSLPAAGLDN